MRNLWEIRRKGLRGPIHLTNGKWMKIVDLAHLVAGQLNVPVLAGQRMGYQNKIDPDPSHLQFQWNTDIVQGLKLVTEQAREYLSSNQHVRKDP